MTAEMDEMIDQAIAESKWLYSTYQQLWFSPEELRDAQQRGKFRWGPINWRLRDPKEMIHAAERECEEAHKRLDAVRKRLESA